MAIFVFIFFGTFFTLSAVAITVRIIQLMKNR